MKKVASAFATVSDKTHSCELATQVLWNTGALHGNHYGSFQGGIPFAGYGGAVVL